MNHPIIHCIGCGRPNELKFLEGRNRHICENCGIIAYQNPCPAAGVLLLHEKRVLLIKRGMEPQKGHWAFPAGFQEIDENPEQAARREMLEETGLTVGKLELFDLAFHHYANHKPVNVAIFLATEARGTLAAGDDVTEAMFFPLDQLPANIAFDHIHRCLNRVKASINL